MIHIYVNDLKQKNRIVWYATTDFGNIDVILLGECSAGAVSLLNAPASFLAKLSVQLRHFRVAHTGKN